MTVIAIYSLAHGLCTLTAVPRSTQPSTLCGTVKWVSAYELSNNNKWRWRLQMVAANLSADSQPKWVGLVWGLAATGRSVCIHQMNQVNSRNDYVMMTVTINIVSNIIIIIIIKPSKPNTVSSLSTSVCMYVCTKTNKKLLQRWCELVIIMAFNQCQISVQTESCMQLPVSE